MASEQEPNMTAETITEVYGWGDGEDLVEIGRVHHSNCKNVAEYMESLVADDRLTLRQKMFLMRAV